MRIAVLGAGVVGVAAAYQLQKDGHEVVVVDRAEGPATFTSFANAGLVAPSHAFAWASPKAPRMMLRSLWRGDQAIRFRPQFTRAQTRWVRRFLGQCTAERAVINTRRKLRLCTYSQAVLQEVVGETALEYDGRRGGLLYFYRSQASFDAAVKKSALLAEADIPVDPLDRDAVVAMEPALAGARDQIAGGVHAPTDESGDAHLFTRRLAEACEARGVEFRFGEEVVGFDRIGDDVRAVKTVRPGHAAGAGRGAAENRVAADAFVLCLGVMSPQLAKELAIDLPIYPVKGYSMTLPITDAAAAPRIGGVDEDNLMAYCPMGERLRVTSTAEIAGYSDAHRPEDFHQMRARAKGLLGDVADFSQPKYWAGLRPMTPTGMPVIDRSPASNFWLNTGHGHMGWTMANGSARILADLVGQRRPAIEREGMRYDA